MARVTLLARKQFRASSFFRSDCFANNAQTENGSFYFFELGDCAGLLAGLLTGWSIWNSFFSC